MGLFTKWVEESGLVVDLSGDMEGGGTRFAVVDGDSGRRVKVRLGAADAARVARGDRIRFLHAPAKRGKPVKRLEVLDRAGPAAP